MTPLSPTIDQTGWPASSLPRIRIVSTGLRRPRRPSRISDIMIGKPIANTQPR